MLVVDASILAPALADDSVEGDAARAGLRGHTLLAPEIVDLEVASVLRRQLMVGHIGEERATLALADLADLPLRRVSHRHLVARCWELRHTVTPYDAAYVALAELMDVVLVTGDACLARAPGPRCRVELVP